MAPFEDLCRELFDAADERFLIEDEQLVVNAFSLDRQYVLSCAIVDEDERGGEGTVDVVLSSDAANAAASLYLDIYDDAGEPMKAAWECVVRWNSPAVTETGMAYETAAEIARAAGLDPADVTVHSSGIHDGDQWVHHLTFEYALWLADDEDPERDASRIMAIAEDGLNRLQELARHWPLAEELEEPEEPEEPEGAAE